MTKREVVRLAIECKRPPYVPWCVWLTVEAREKLVDYYRNDDLSEVLHDHIVALGTRDDYFVDIGEGRVRDYFGVVWDRSVDKDIGQPSQDVLPEPALKDYRFPDPLNPGFFESIPDQLDRFGGRFRIFNVGFSLYERAWTMRGMTNLMMDFHDHPDFVDELLNTIADYNIAQVRKALEYDIDAVMFGDDWGRQRGLQMSPGHWRRFIRPVLRRMCGVVREADKLVMIHSCGKVEELFDDLIEIGLNCFNPFQPEVMDVFALKKQYHGRLAFYGGLSTQRTLPYGTPEDVGEQTRRLIEMGSDGSYICAPAHSVESDVPVENIVAFLGALQAQPGWQG